MIIYPLSQEERDQLVALNNTDACWAACWYGNAEEGPNSVCIEEETLNDPAFIAHKELFDTFPEKEPIEYEHKIDPRSPMGIFR
jgi:hypothetical protein